jgi:hypothetical protein
VDGSRGDWPRPHTPCVSTPEGDGREGYTMKLGGWTLVGALLAVVLIPSSLPAQSGFRYVHPTDPTCGNHNPCYTTIQAAVNAATAGEHVILQSGTYHQQVNVTAKNTTPSATEADRIVIEADPVADVGSVVLQGSVTQCTNGYAIRLQQSKFITVRGLTITGAGGQAISLLGGNNQNQAIHLERLRIYGNGSASCDGGITIARGNPGTVVLNSLIYANGRNGFATIDADGGPHYLIGDTIHANQWSGVSVTRNHEIYLVNNAITANGTAPGSTGGRFGVSRESSTSPQPAGIHLLNNLVCGNRLGEINGPALDASDSANLTPTGTEGPGVTGRAGCDVVSNVYGDVDGPDGVANTSDDDFTPVTASPLLDAGLDPRTLGLDTAFNPLLESDYLKTAARPRLGTPGGTARFDIGAREPDVVDEIAPLVAILAPPANSYVRLQVPVQAQATDQGSGVATFALRVGTQALTATLNPALRPPAASVTASATWDTTGVPDGTYTLTAEAEDAAGNTGSASRVLIADNTPPDTQITGGPASVVTATSATFTFFGTDNLTTAAELEFAWRLDGAAYSAFSTATTATLSTLSAGSHTFEVKSRDRAGNEDSTPAPLTFVIVGLQITIMDPMGGATVPSGLLLVRGTVQSAPIEVGVSVNGYPAFVSGTEWAAEVPIEPGSNTLTALAVAIDGGQASTTVTVTASETATSVLLLVNPRSGPAPLQVGWQVSNQTGRELISLELDRLGTGGFDAPTFTVADVQTTYTSAGLYFPVLRATDDQGAVYAARTRVLVEDPQTVINRFQSLWSQFKLRLQASDIPGALMFLAPVVQQRFQDVFQQLGPNLPAIAAGLGAMQVVDQLDDLAETLIIQLEDGVPMLHFIYFRRNSAGQWLIEEM